MGKGRKPCCDKAGVKKGPWSEAEDIKLISFIQKHGHSNWRALPRLAGLARCGKSCRLRWVNYLRPDLKRGNFSPQEEETIIKLHETLGNKWSKIASHFPGRTDNEIKNVWNTHLKKRLKAKESSNNSLMSSGISTKDSSLNEALDGTRTDCSQQVIMHQTSPSSSSSISYSSQASFSDHQMSYYTPELDQVGAPDPNLVGCHRDEMVFDSGFLDELIEIPFEPNLDLWDLLDGDSKSNRADSEAQSSKLDQIPNCPLSESDSRINKEDGGSWWWLVYLENELGLDHDQPKSRN